MEGGDQDGDPDNNTTERETDASTNEPLPPASPAEKNLVSSMDQRNVFPSADKEVRPRCPKLERKESYQRR